MGTNRLFAGVVVLINQEIGFVTMPGTISNSVELRNKSDLPIPFCLATVAILRMTSPVPSDLESGAGSYGASDTTLVEVGAGSG